MRSLSAFVRPPLAVALLVAACDPASKPHRDGGRGLPHPSYLARAIAPKEIHK